MCICIKCGCFSCKNSNPSGEEKKDADCLDMFLAIFLPPAGIYKKEGGCTGKFWVNVVLTAAGFVPGSIHAAIVISSN
ncbi:hypothetical protein CRYUN_Cryun23aG0116200 [Craigia yunnanensis]